MATSAAAHDAKRWLSKAARALRTADPVDHLASFIDESLQLPPGAQAYRRPHTFETHFSERTPRHLEVGMTVGDPFAPPQEKVDGATRAMRHVVHNNFGPQALYWLDGRTEAIRSGRGDAWMASGFDRDGVRQARVHYAWGPQTAESLTAPMYDTVRQALEAMPALRPAMTTVRCGRSYGSQEISFRVEGVLRLADLRPLMDRFGLGGQHTRLVNALAFVLGARFTLPPDTTSITLRPTSAGIEMRVDVDLEGIADIPPNVASLLQLQLAERPQSLTALERWVAAMTPDGYLTPGALSVLSVLVRPNLGARLAIDLRPSVVVGEQGPVATPSTPQPDPVPAAAGMRSPWVPRS